MDNSSKHTGLHQIGQIAVPVSDVARANEFYEDVLGLRSDTLGYGRYIAATVCTEK